MTGCMPTLSKVCFEAAVSSVLSRRKSVKTILWSLLQMAAEGGVLFIFFSFFIFLIFIGVELLYNVVLASTAHKNE